jgi:hypothetical protein
MWPASTVLRRTAIPASDQPLLCLLREALHIK